MGTKVEHGAFLELGKELLFSEAGPK